MKNQLEVLISAKTYELTSGKVTLKPFKFALFNEVGARSSIHCRLMDIQSEIPDQEFALTLCLTGRSNTDTCKSVYFVCEVSA